jgi:hypothetical protein
MHVAMGTEAVSLSPSGVLGMTALHSDLNFTLSVGHCISNGRQRPGQTGAGKPPCKYTQAMKLVRDRKSAFQFGTV